jgi:protein-S-isoprenylcysteine O-methyltransferase Ste14
MPDQALLYRCGLWLILVVSALSFPLLFFYTAPYGRHQEGGVGPGMNATLGWLLMEFPAPLVFAIVYGRGELAGELVPLLLLGVWQAHYFYRSFAYPLLLKVRKKQTPVAAVAVGFCFNAINAFLNAYAITNLGSHLTADWLLDPRFAIGILLMATGFSINFHSDKILRALRAPGETGYRIPHGGLYRWVSSPNYLGEILEWAGFALAAWTSAALAFLLFTVANLLPRAFSHHRWYGERFEEYPQERKAILPRLL